MTFVKVPKVFGTGLIALDLVISPDPDAPIHSWAGGTCGNVLSILAFLGWDAYPIARMNGDPASDRIRSDMTRWGVHLDWANCAPTTSTPIIVQKIRRGQDGRPKHRFSWTCPQCGEWLPSFKAVTVSAIEVVMPALDGAVVFFLDRLSRAALSLAAEASKRGAVVVFEPSGKVNDKLMAEAVTLAHVVKYANERLAGIDGLMGKGAATLVEIQTLGEQGLKYRHRLDSTVSGWTKLNAISAPRLADTCGSGDWCTAGLIAKAMAGGQAGLRASGVQGLQDALIYGQALAAWNCGFEGARGGMYAVERRIFEAQISRLLQGQFEPLAANPVEVGHIQPIGCPACPKVLNGHGTTRAARL